MTGPEQEQRLPELWERPLDKESLAQLFADLACQVRIVGIREKSSGAEYAGEEIGDLSGPRERLQSGQVHAVQIHYEYEGQEWRDTIVRSGGGWKLIRMPSSSLVTP
jgi:hypothetical protein